jgi:hypothetical protein
MHAFLRAADIPYEGQRPSNKPAQGNALGSKFKKDKALKGRNKLGPPFQGFDRLSHGSQGVALGWLVCAPLVLSQLS